MCRPGRSRRSLSPRHSARTCCLISSPWRKNWFGLVVSTKTPTPVVARLKAAMLAAQNDPAYRDSLAKQGVTAGEPGVESFATLIRKEIERWKPIVTSPDVKIE